MAMDSFEQKCRAENLENFNIQYKIPAEASDKGKVKKEHV